MQLPNLAVMAAFVLAAAAPATAQDQQGLQTPSHNIFCVLSPAYGDQPMELRCDVQHMSNRPPPNPRSCQEGSWGDSVTLHSTGPGRFICHGDTTADPSLEVLGYGQTWIQNGFRCDSATSGLTCRNRQGHGFTLSRSAQRTF